VNNEPANNEPLPAGQVQDKGPSPLKILLRTAFLVLACLAAFAPSTPCGAEPLRIISFNTLWKGQRDPNYVAVARMMKGSGANIIALQEVRYAETVTNLCKELGWKWFCASAPVGSEGCVQFAFLWDRSRCSLIQDRHNPILWPEPEVGTFHRPPFIIGLRESSTGRSFWLIDVHLYFGNGSKADVAERKAELRSLERTYTIFEKHVPKVYVAILGDFNLPLRDIQAENLTFRAYQSSKTTLTRDGKSYSESYDHFAFNDRLRNDLRPAFRSLNVIRRFFHNDSALYRNTVSDHIPICMELPE
jgi:hypothetical protein